MSDVLEQSGIDSKYIELEITESTVLKPVERALESKKEMQKPEIRIGLDDCGTAYSSLSYLSQLCN